MITPPIKELAAAGANRAQLERTVANELPQELSRLPEHHEFSAVNSFPKKSEFAAQGGRPAKARRTQHASALPKSRKRAVTSTTTGFTDDGHPTILAATCG